MDLKEGDKDKEKEKYTGTGTFHKGKDKRGSIPSLKSTTQDQEQVQGQREA